MADKCSAKKPGKPCPSCPWRIDQDARDIPNFDLAKAETLAGTCPDERGMGPDFGARLFACHKSKEGEEFACAGWLAAVGSSHPMVRFAVYQGKLSPDALSPGKGWPRLHSSFQEVIAKLRATAITPDEVS